MIDIKAARTTLTAALAAVGDDVTVYGYWPERPHPPCVMLAPASPYLDGSDVVTFGAWRIHWALRLYAPIGTNETVTDALDDLIARTLDVLLDQDVAVESVSEPMGHAANAAIYLGADLTISTIIKE